MRLPEISIRRPVLAIVMNLLLVLVGLVSYDRMSVREYPDIDVPVVNVEVAYPGASAAIMETQVASVLEDGLSGIEGVDYIRSVNRAEQSQITIRFKLNRDPDGAAADVRDRVGRVRGELPDGIDEPVISKVEADADAMIWLTFSSDRHSPLEVTDFAERRVKDRMETVTGVASVILAGERRYAMRIWLDAERLAAYSLSVQDVEDALRRQNLEVPAGRVESSSREFTVLAETDLNTPEAFADVILQDTGGYLVRLRDVAQVELGARDERTIARFNGKPSVAIGIVKQSTANPLELSHGVRTEVGILTEFLPEGMEVYVAYDGAVFIEHSIAEVYKTIAEAVALVILVIFLFLRSARATLIPLVTITNRYLEQMEAMIKTTPEVLSYFGIVGYPSVTDALLFADMQPWEERDRSAQAVVGELAPKLFGGITGLMAFAASPPPLGQDPTSKDLEIVLQTSGGYDELAKAVAGVMARARGHAGLDAVDSDYKPNKPELKVTSDRDKTATVGLDPATVGRTLETLLGAREVTRFKRGAEQYDVVVQLQDSERRDPRDLSDLLLRSRDGSLVQLDNLVSVRESVAPRELNHFDKLRSATISANLKEGQSLGEALEFMQQTVKETAPSDTRIDYLGGSREYIESGSEIYLVFVLALSFIYLVLAAQFESFRDPLIILLSVPTALAGALLTLHLTGNSLNIYSQIGMVTLVGLITKHGILIVEFANQLRAQGKDRFDAVLESAALRMRPILMTTAAMVLGALPLALASGAGAEGRRAIGWVIVGGMGFGTLMTLFVVPAVYLLLAQRKAGILPQPEPQAIAE